MAEAMSAVVDGLVALQGLWVSLLVLSVAMEIVLFIVSTLKGATS